VTASKPPKFGRQPIREIIHHDGRTVRGFVRMLQTDEAHALLALAGRVPPSPQLRAELTTKLGLPVELLFTRAALDAEYHGPRGRLVTS
jgi:hypothetical protein